MFFYNSLLLLSNILIVVVHTQSTNQSSLGTSSCSYGGENSVDCGSVNVSIADIPYACTAIIVDGFYMDINNNVDAPTGEDDMFDKLDTILQSSKNVFIIYGHITQEEWSQVLACESCNNGTNSQDEMKGLKAFLDQHPGIKGLLITNLELNEYSVDSPKYSENFKVYLDTIRSNFPDLAIGLYLIGKFIVDQYTNPQLTWLNFTIIDPSVDFYSISVVTFNDCSDEFRHLGTAPIGSSNSSNVTSASHTNSTNCTNATNLSSNSLANTTVPNTNYTLSNLRDILADLSVPKNKTYYRYGLNPLSQNSSMSVCDTTISQVCLNKTHTKSWCLDTMDGFNAKGKFAKDNGAGFIVSFIELNDPQNDCKCGPYPSFNAILNGFNGKRDNTTKQCALSNRS